MPLQSNIFSRQHQQKKSIFNNTKGPPNFQEQTANLNGVIKEMSVYEKAPGFTFEFKDGAVNSNLEEGTPENLFPHFKTFLIFGKFIGLVPIEGLFQSNVDLLVLRSFSIPSVINILICLLLGSTAAVNFLMVGRSKVSNAAEYASVPAGFLYYSLGTFIYVYYLRNSSELVQILQQWSRLKLFYTRLDSGLWRYVNILAGIVMTSAILENITGQLRCVPALFPVAPHEKNMSAVEIYYVREQGAWAYLVPYNPVVSICLFFANKFALYSWNCMDITLAICARALHFKFRMLFQIGHEVLFEGSVRNAFDIQKWRQLSKDFEKLIGTLREMLNFLSPLIFVSFAANMYFIILHVHYGLMMPSGHEPKSAVAAIYAKWAFIHLIARLCMVSIISSKINTWAHKSSLLFSRCPSTACVMEVERTDNFINSNTIGFTGLGCFWVTKPLLLQIIGVVFTFEIVLLQASQTPVAS